jgi:putative DNA primase/helicase
MSDYDSIPTELRERRQWMLYDRSAETDRRPFGWNADRQTLDFGGSWKEPTDWLTFDEACDAAATKESYGIGYVFRQADEYIPMDVDGCFDDQGQLKDWVPDLASFEQETYIEYSPSGDGLHILVEHPQLPPWWDNEHFTEKEHEGMEAYENKFFTVTGEQHAASLDTIAAVNPDGFLWNAYTAITGDTPDLDTKSSAGTDGYTSSSGDINVSVYDLLSKASYPEGERRSHPVHGSGTGTNFHVDEGGETFRCWRCEVTGNALHLLGMEEGIISCGDWSSSLSDSTWSEIFDAARERGLAVPAQQSQQRQQPSIAGDGGVSTGNTQGSSGEDTGPERSATDISPNSLVAVANLDVDEDSEPSDVIADLNDRQAAACVWALVKRSGGVHVRALRENGELWCHDSDRGIWTAEGERPLRQAARRAVTPMNYGKNVFEELKEQVRSDPAAEVKTEDLGLDAGTVALENGLLDLDAAAEGAGFDALRELRPTDYALTRLPVTYDPSEAYDEWQALVDEWAEAGKADALQEYVGYCIHVGALPIHRALLLVGAGANGKGTFLSVVRALLGDTNTTSIELQTLANERDAVADFYGSLANIDDDLSSRKLGQGLGMFKKLVAGDRVRGRHLYESGFEFDATGKQLYAANEVPDVSSDVSKNDEAFWRRWLLIEFPNHYSKTERDIDLADRLTKTAALSSVLNWAIEGRKRLLEQGWFTDEERYAQGKRERWQAWGDSVTKFIKQCVERDPSADNMTTNDAHRRYAAWCRDTDLKPVGQQQLTTTLKQEDIGYGSSVRVNGSVQRGYKALGLSDDVPDHADTPDRQNSAGQQTSLK